MGAGAADDAGEEGVGVEAVEDLEGLEGGDGQGGAPRPVPELEGEVREEHLGREAGVCGCRVEGSGGWDGRERIQKLWLGCIIDG